MCVTFIALKANEDKEINKTPGNSLIELKVSNKLPLSRERPTEIKGVLLVVPPTAFIPAVKGFVE